MKVLDPQVTDGSEVVYPSGPMTGYLLSNFPAFDEARDYAVSRGMEVVSPADLDRFAGYDPTRGDVIPPEEQAAFRAQAMRRDMAAISRCTSLWLLPGWENSPGARMELGWARDLELKIYAYFPGGPVGDRLRRVTGWYDFGFAPIPILERRPQDDFAYGAVA